MIAPTLFVGLGGTGSKLVAKLEERNRNSGENISYVVFDTDANELRALKKKGFTGHIIQTSANMTVGEYLDEDKKAAKEWFPVNKILNRKTLTEGAGQVRAISRLAFDATVRSGGMDPLHRAIEELYKLNSDSMKQSMRVVIVSSLAGGTGSGILLPVALYIRNYLISTYQQYSAIIRGFFIMPEVFDKVNSDPAERNSLTANTYATLRELDAFLRKGDGSLEPRYAKRIRFDVPVAGTDTYQDLNVMPYDFCFLFDKRASDNSILDSFDDYMNQAADSVQALSVGLTSKRNNSSEDNIIKELCQAKDKGRCNRYCGVGTSTLIYPYEDIRDYVSIGWAKDVLAKEWLEIDKAYKQVKEEEKEKRKTILLLNEIERSQHYVEYVETTDQNILVNLIKECCNSKEDDGTGKWFDYVSAIKDHIKNDILPSQQEVKAAKEECESAIEALNQNVKNATKSFTDDIKLNFEEYKRIAYAEAARKGTAVAYDLFLSGAVSGKDKEYNLEHWIKSDEKKGFHPSAVRYFLYKTIEEMETEIAISKKKLADIDKYFKGDFEEIIFDVASTKKKVETREESHNDVGDHVGMLGNKKAEEIQKLFTEGYKAGMEKVEEYRLLCMYAGVLEEGIKHLTQLSSNYEKFYDNFEACINSLDDSREVILSKYRNVNGKTKRYICTSEKCLKKISQSTTNFNSAVDVPGDLCDSIYLALLRLTLQTRFNANDGEGINTRYYKNIFDDTIMKFWKDSVEKNYGQILDLNVIDALCKEAEYEKGYLDMNEKLRYAESVFEEMSKLSTPFITKPVGADRRTIKSCAYHRSLNELKGAPGDLVKRCLKDNGGECDSDDEEKTSISRYEVTFTKANYGLRLTDFGKFAPKKDSPTYPEDRQAGSYYTSYYDTVNHIHPNSEKTSRISPHLDRNWHYIISLPELDTDEQGKIEERICRALIYGLIMNKFKYEQRTIYAEKYKYVLTFKGMDNADELIVDDDICDCFYELLTALIKNAMIVEQIIRDSEEEIHRHVNSMRDLDDNIFIKRLKKFKIDEVDKMFKSEEQVSQVRSIFEIPLIYARTVPVAEFDEVFATKLITTILKIMEESVMLYAKAEDADFVLGRFIVEQMELFRDNLKKLEEIWIGIDKEAIVSNINLTISDKLYDLELYEASEWVRGTMSDEEYKAYKNAKLEKEQRDKKN